ncbi:hypothetical protein BGW80DRAFT_568580 [Lactifluus volemus]|nr:hypothetical protein BGW80DRAFT_568580 [Lactifluus volemus]
MLDANASVISPRYKTSTLVIIVPAVPSGPRSLSHSRNSHPINHHHFLAREQEKNHCRRKGFPFPPEDHGYMLTSRV